MRMRGIRGSTLEWPGVDSEIAIESRVRWSKQFGMTVIKVGVREFRYNAQRLLEYGIPVLVTRREKPVGIYLPMRDEHPTLEELRQVTALLDRGIVRAEAPTPRGK